MAKESVGGSGMSLSWDSIVLVAIRSMCCLFFFVACENERQVRGSRGRDPERRTLAIGHIRLPFGSKQGRRGRELGKDLVHCALVVLQVTDGVGVGDGALESGACEHGSRFSISHSLTGTDGRGTATRLAFLRPVARMGTSRRRSWPYHQSQHRVDRV